MRAICSGLLASFFFASTFILNRSMDLSGGHWAWSTSLRYLFMLPLLLILVGLQGKLSQAFTHLMRYPAAYIGWSLVGFVLFYAPLCFAASYGEGWLVASTWQLTIICGPLLAPLFKQRRSVDGQGYWVKQPIPWRALRWSLLILMGVALMQLEHAHSVGLMQVLLCVIPVLIAAFAYPLGNRKLMETCQTEVDTFQRVLNMTIASLPFWLILAGLGYYQTGLPPVNQVGQSFLVALLSGVISTLLFFSATHLVRHDMHKLSAVEATQSGELVFALLGEILLLGSPFPSILSIMGLCLVIIGMIIHSLWPMWQMRRH